MHRTQDERTRILIIVDAAETGALLGDAIASSRDLQCVGIATDKQTSMRLHEQRCPHVVVAGLSTPQGHTQNHTLGTIQDLASRYGLPILAVCPNSPQGGQVAVAALQQGALDIVSSPADAPHLEMLLRDDLCSSIRALLTCGTKLQPKAGLDSPIQRMRSGAANALKHSAAAEQQFYEAAQSIVVLAAGIGGPRALLQLFPALSNPLPPLIIAQPLSTHIALALAEQLARCSSIRCKVAENGEILQPNTAYLTPAGQQTVVVRQNGSPTLLVHADLPQQVGRFAPSVDVLMQSAAIAYGNKCLGLLMTGNGRDGVAGARAITIGGGFVLAQDVPSCLASGTVRLAKKLNYIDRSVAIDDIADALASVTPILGRPEISVVRSPLFDPGPLHGCAV